jgi:hypothetical protein
VNVFHCSGSCVSKSQKFFRRGHYRETVDECYKSCSVRSKTTASKQYIHIYFDNISIGERCWQWSMCTETVVWRRLFSFEQCRLRWTTQWHSLVGFSFVERVVFWLSLIVEMNQLYSCVVDKGRKRSTLNTTQLYLEQQSSSSERKRAVTTLEVKVGSQWIQCPLAGGVVKVKTSEYAGELDCPSSETMCCTRLNNCHERGACVDGACVCHPGWEGRQCERAVEPRVRLASSRE